MVQYTAVQQIIKHTTAALQVETHELAAASVFTLLGVVGATLK